MDMHCWHVLIDPGPVEADLAASGEGVTMNPASWTDWLAGHRTEVIAWLSALITMLASVNANYHWVPDGVGLPILSFLMAVGLWTGRDATKRVEAKVDSADVKASIAIVKASEATATANMAERSANQSLSEIRKA